MADFKNVKGSKVEFTLSISEDELKKLHVGVISDYKKEVTVKGFRKGHAPEEAVVGQVGLHNIAREAFNRGVDKAYKKFIMDNNLRPVSAPEIASPDKPAKEGEPMVLNGSVELYPEVKVDGYEKIKTERTEVKVEKEDIDKTLSEVLAQYETSVPVKRAAKDGDTVKVDFRGKDKDGKTLDRTDGKDMQFKIGTGQFLPDLEKAYVGMKAGEEKTDVKVAFPKDYPSEDFAGKKVPFDIKMNEVAESKAPELTEELIEKVTGTKKSESEFRADIEKMILQQKEQKVFQEGVGKYQDALAKLVKGELPQSWIEREVQARLQKEQQNPAWDASNEEKAKKEFAAAAEKNLRVFLGLSKIIEEKGIDLDKDELAQAELMMKHQGKEGNDAELEQEKLHMKIDKYLRGLIMKEA